MYKSIDLFYIYYIYFINLYFLLGYYDNYKNTLIYLDIYRWGGGVVTH